MISVDVDYEFRASCSECDGSISESSEIYCKKCYEGEDGLISGPIKAALVLLPKVHCIGCKKKWPSALMVEKITGFMCLGCAVKYEENLFGAAMAATA